MWEIIKDSLLPMADVLKDNWPNLLATLWILVVGWIVAKVLKIMIVRGFKIIKLDVVAEKAGIEGFLKKGGMEKDSIEILGLLVYWIVLILFFVMVLGVWNIDVGLSKTLLPFLPKVFAALVILILGLFLSSVLGDIVRTAAANVDIEYAFILGKATKWILIIFVVMTSIQQLELETEFISWGFLIVLGSFGLGLGLAIGLGTKDIVAKKIGAWVVKMETEAKQTSIGEAKEAPKPE